MKHRLLPFFSLFAILGSLVLPALTQALRAPLLPASYLLFSRSSLALGGNDPLPRALLITDPDEIQRVQALAATIAFTGHRCGYDWSMRFWASPSKVTGGYHINDSCDGYDPQLKAYFTTSGTMVSTGTMRSLILNLVPTSMLPWPWTGQDTRTSPTMTGREPA
jgi:hypothetical protein